VRSYYVTGGILTQRLHPDPLRIVAIGGGTGLSTLLRGLKRYTLQSGELEPEVEITAVVTVTDDGGSSGRLRREFDILPPGDIRNCMVALSEDEALLSRLFQYRFAGGRGLKGHSFGNLFLAALSDLSGDFAEAVKLSSEVLAIAGRIFPSTADKATLEATLESGTVVRGETRISKSRRRIARVRLDPGRCQPMPETLEAIAEADLITFGPGSLFTSVIPNVLVDGIPEAIRASRAARAYFCNLMSQPGETTDFAASDHVRAIHDHAGMTLLDSVIVNTAEIHAPLLHKYASQRARPVVNDIEMLEAMGLAVVKAPLASEEEKVRHDPDRAAAIAVRLASEARAGERRRQRLRARAS
jgi:uncharacterized cofD-like protein